MNADDLFYLGTFIKTHGLKGGLILQMDTDQPECFDNLSSIFLDESGLKVPFFVSSSKLLPNHRLSLSFEEVNSIKNAECFIGKKAFLPLSFIPKLSGNQFYYHEVLGFQVMSTSNCYLGSIKSIRDDVQPALFDIYKEGKNILIPIVDPFIELVDRKQKQIFLKLPEGMMDLYV